MLIEFYNLLIPLNTCIPINDLLTNKFGTPITKLAGAVGGLLFVVAIAVTVIAVFAAVAMAVSKHARDWLMNVFRPSLALIVGIVAISLLVIVAPLINNTFCG